MQWFDNMKISGKMLTGFIVIALIAGAIGAFGSIKMQTLDSNDEMLYEGMTLPLSYTSYMLNDFEKILVLARDIIIANDAGRIAEINAEITNLRKSLDENSKKYEATVATDEARKGLAEFTESRKATGGYLEQVIALALVNRDAEAMEILQGNMTKAAQIESKALENLVALNTEAAQQTSEANQSAADNAILLMICLSVAGVVLAIAYGLFLSRRITRPVQEVVAAADKLTAGDVNVSLDYKSKDEIGDLVQSFGRMAENIRKQAETAAAIAAGNLDVTFNPNSDADIMGNSLQAMLQTINAVVTELNQIITAAREGHLEQRADASHFCGGWKNLVSGINQVLDAVIDPLNVAADYVERIACGDIPEKITDDYKGDFNKIKNNLNQCIDGLGGLVEASQVLARISVNDYTTSVDGQYQGIFAENARSANLTLERVRAIQDVMNKLSEGDMSDLERFRKIGKRSENDNMIPTIVRTIEAIEAMHADATMLSKAAVDGRLETRADASKHRGSYHEIVQGINDTLDAVIEPITEASAVLQEMAKGRLDVQVNGSYKGDHANLKDTLNMTILSLKTYVSEISQVLGEMSGGNLDVAITGDYRGDFIALKNSLNSIINAFNDVIGEINQAADQVSSGSNQVADTSQSLSQAATEQAAAIQQITSSVAQIASQTRENAINAQKANELALNAREHASEGNQQMQDMLNAMKEINDASSSISKIIKVIDEIAFQTNILALNAAVEAARAGEHGKGFAVVAEEVRNLAARSANAAKETTDMIEGSMRTVEIGTGMAQNTAQALDRIVEGVSQATELVGEIATASNQQATGVAQVDNGISQVAEIIQTNTATSEQSAAASQQLSSQAEMLKQRVSQFSLRKKGLGSEGLAAVSPDILRLIQNAAQINGGYHQEVAHQPKRKVTIDMDDYEFGKY